MAVMSVEPNFVKIGQNIKIMRIRKGVTQSELAKKLGISQTHMSNLEHGRVSVNLKVLLRLSHYFSCGVDALLGLTLNTEVKPQEVEDKYTEEETRDVVPLEPSLLVRGAKKAFPASEPVGTYAENEPGKTHEHSEITCPVHELCP